MSINPNASQLSEIDGLLGVSEEEVLDDHSEDELEDDVDVDNAAVKDDEDAEIDEESEDDSEDESEDESEADKDESEESETEDETDESEVETLNQLAKHLEVDDAVIYDIKVPMGDGLEPISISALKDNYMETERTRTQLSKDRESLDSAFKGYQEQYNKLTTIPESNQKVLDAATQMRAIEQANDAFDWEELEARDPTQAILQRQKLNAAYDQAGRNYQAAITEFNQNSETVQANIKNYHKAKILENIPEWKDPKEYQKDADAIGEMLTKYGFDKKEIENVYDYRLSMIVRDLMKLKSKSTEADAIKTRLKLKKKSKPLKGVNNQRREPAKKMALNKKIATASKSTDMNLKVSAVSDLLKTI